MLDKHRYQILSCVVYLLATRSCLGETTLADNTTEITTSADNTTEITTSADTTTEITTSADNTTEITTSADITTEITTSADITTDITTSADITTDKPTTVEITTTEEPEPAPDGTAFYVTTSPQVSDANRMKLVDGNVKKCVKTSNVMHTIIITQSMVNAFYVTSSTQTARSIRIYLKSKGDAMYVFIPQQEPDVQSATGKLQHCAQTDSNDNQNTLKREFECACPTDCAGQKLIIIFKTPAPRTHWICEFSLQ